MKMITRKDFIKGLGIGTSAIILSAIPSMTAFAADDLVEVNLDSLASELTSWHQAKGSSFTLESVEHGSRKFTRQNIAYLIENLQSIHIEKTTVPSNDADFSSNNVMPREIMPVTFSRSVRHTLSHSIAFGITGWVDIDVTIDATYDALRNNMISVHADASQGSSENLESVSIGSVSTSYDSDLTVSYSVPCSASFVWNDPVLNVAFRTNTSDTFSGEVSK